MSIKIIKRNLKGLKIKTENIGIYLFQILNELDGAKIKDPSKQYNKIENILNSILDDGTDHSFRFFVFPEVSVPFVYIEKIIQLIKEKIPSNTVIIFGIEHISVSDCRKLIDKLEKREKNRIEKIFNSIKAEDRPVNPCLILAKAKTKLNNLRCYLQLKTAPSKFEQINESTLSDLVVGNFIYRFTISKSMSFIVLICSDFISRPTGQNLSLINEIDHEFAKNELLVDFMINIQHNPSPDDTNFVQSIRRIYDYGRDEREDLCTIFLNSFFDTPKTSGLSKIIFNNNKVKNIPLRTDLKLLKPIDAPVIGYEFAEMKERIIHLNFKRLPKSWKFDDKVPIQINSYQFEKNELKHVDDDFKFLIPYEKIKPLSHETYEDFAHRLSAVGLFEEARKYYKRTYDYWVEKKIYFKAASAAREIAKECRQIGNYQDASFYYRIADIHAIQSPDSIHKQLLLWKNKASLILVEYLTKGECKRTFESWRYLIKEIEGHEESGKNHQIKLNLMHARRAQADVRRMMGQYDEARQLFNDAYKYYNYSQDEEKAYSALGMADSYRMLEDIKSADDKYEEVEKYCREKNNKKLLLRLLRNRAELYRVFFNDQQAFEKIMRELEKDTYETDYHFGKLYYNLIIGGNCIYLNPDQAKEYFEQVLKISKNHNDMEKAHAYFGMAETARIGSDVMSARENYGKALAIYRQLQIPWGIIRTSIGLRIIGERQPNVNSMIEEPAVIPVKDRELIARFDAIKKDELLFLNIP